MHRFRKKSDAKRSDLQSSASPGRQFDVASPTPSHPVSTYSTISQSSSYLQPLPTLPPVSDFRTSLIFPDLAKRFTLLRSSNGDLISLDDLKHRFAQQRVNGNDNISEEEEDMLLEALSRIRRGNAGGSLKGGVSGSDSSCYVKSEPPSSPFSSTDFVHSSARQSSSSHSTTTATSSAVHDSVMSGTNGLSSLSPSPSRSSKRHSNNLFGAGFRDRNYMRKQTSRLTGSTRSELSEAPSESTNGSAANAVIDSYSEAPRSLTPENVTVPGSTTSSPSLSDDSRSSSRSPVALLFPTDDNNSVDVTSQLSKRLTNNQLKRMSASLDMVIREIEEEAEDQVLVPRTPSINQNGFAAVQKADVATADNDVQHEAVTHAITTANDSAVTFSGADVDRPSSAGGFRSPSPFYAASSKSPVARTMGQSPGLFRSITPRNVDVEDQRSHSTTPRANSPIPLQQTLPLSLSASTLWKNGSLASTSQEERRPSSPLSAYTMQRNTSGTSTPEHRQMASGDSSLFTHSPTPWHRPSSPLSSSAFPLMGSRPGTPSNVTWTMNQKSPVTKPLGRSGTFTSHSRNASTTSIGGAQEVAELKSAAKEASRSPARSPTSGVLNNTNGDVFGTRSKFLSNGSSFSPSLLPSLDAEASILYNGGPRSPTPSRELSNTTGSLLGSDNDTIGRSINRTRSPPFITPPSSPFSPKSKTNPLMIDPLSNSSHSSLLSAGSSYHSWEDKNDSGIAFINAVEMDEPAWHDIPEVADTTSSTVTNNKAAHRSKIASDDPEAILRQHTGLSKLDLMLIQGKLLEAATLRAKSNETRSPSTLRRRRPSTAQSIHSFGGPSRTTSPAPQVAASPSYARSTDNVAKASALLNSLAESINKPEPQEPGVTEGQQREHEIVAPVPITSSPSRRNKDLADILFGADLHLTETLGYAQHVQTEEPSIHKNDAQKNGDAEAEIAQAAPATYQASSSGAAPQPQSPSSPVLPYSRRPDPGDLLREVQTKTEAAMAQLHRADQLSRTSPNNTVHRKRINRQDISSPTLLQSSASIEKMPSFPTSPLSSPGPGPQRSASKLSFGIRRLRNTLKGKPSSPNGEEVTPWTNEALKSPSFNSPQIANHTLPSTKPVLLSPGSTRSFNGFQSTASLSPPASAGPSLKTFMSRFRKKAPSESGTETDQHNPSSSLNSSLTSSSSVSPDDRSHNHMPFSAPPTPAAFPMPSSSKTAYSPLLTRKPTDATTFGATPMPISGPPPGSDPAALRRFFDAAQDIGLGKVALDYLASVNPEWTPSTPTVIVTGHDSAKNSIEDNRPREETLSPFERVGSPTSDYELPADLSRSRSLREYQTSPAPAVPRRVREIADEHGNGNGAVVRRTIIFPSASGSSTDLASLVRKASKKANRASALSTLSNRSVHDRVPTPPPAKAKRQSVDVEPPVPTLPSSRSWVSQSASRGFSDSNIEKTNSLHDSFYDMYTGDRTGSSQGYEGSEPPKSPIDEFMPDNDGGQAIEITEMANGETIWSIVNGLRADDVESVYHRRVSVASAFSEGPHEAEGEQLFFKEHNRNLSKGSSRSNLGLQRKGTLTGGGPPSKNRPETKVFYSSSTHIARLIEQLSRSADAGSFNIKPSKPSGGGHSHSGSMQSESDAAHWTVEERLDHMLGVVGTAS